MKSPSRATVLFIVIVVVLGALGAWQAERVLRFSKDLTDTLGGLASLFAIVSGLAGGLLLLWRALHGQPELEQSTRSESPRVPPPPEPSLPPPSPETLRQEYLAGLVNRAGQVDLAAIDPRVAAEEGRNPPRLESIYTSLRVRARQQEEVTGRRPREPEGFEAESEGQLPSVVTVLDKERRLVLLGDPGSGKSTFVRYLAVCLAGELLGRSDVNLTVLRQPLPDEEGQVEGDLQAWSAPVRVPLLVVLRDFAATGLPAAGEKATAAHLWAFLGKELGAYLPSLREELGKDGGYLLFDGLDEVPQANARRAQLVDAVLDFVGKLPKCRVVVTCRSYAYQDRRWHLGGYPVAELAPFDPGQIRRFVRLWYQDAAARGSVKTSVAPERAEVLLRAIFRNRHMPPLAKRPLLLTLMASLHAFSGRELPERREELYSETVELLLYRWEKVRRVKTEGGSREEPSLADWLETSRSKIREALEELAFTAHARQTEGERDTADLSGTELVERLMKLRREERQNPAELLDYLRDRAGILHERVEGVFTFPHRSFQEYLAACHLAASATYPDPLADLVRSDPERWREVALLAGATASAKVQSPLWELVGALCRCAPGEAKACDADGWGAHVAAQALVERWGRPEVPAFREELFERVRGQLVHLLRAPLLPARERALAGRNLAVLGDPRESVTTLDGLEFCWVPAGKFLMGSREGEPDSVPWEYHQHEVELAGYWLARFPVTVGQWQEYVAASRVEPGYADSLKGSGNEPVALVSWHEALACCRWLTERWRGAGLLPVGWEVRLPSEAEWEKAARGGLEVPARPVVAFLGRLGEPELGGAAEANPWPGRVFPWVGEASGEHANYLESGINGPSAVGAFPLGMSPYGCEELSGNVWEWTRSLWGEKFEEPHFIYPYPAQAGREDLEAGDEVFRVLRGGSYFFGARGVRCADRGRNHPDFRNDFIGFRLLLSPFSSGL